MAGNYKGRPKGAYGGGKYQTVPGLFESKIKQIYNGAIKPIEPYNAREKIKFSCKKGHTWLINSQAVLGGHGGCGECYGHHRRTQDSYQKEVKKKFKGKIRVVGIYNGDGKPVKLFCAAHKNIWEACPQETLSKKGGDCPLCANEARRKQPHKLTQEQFESRVTLNNPTLRVTGTYKGLNYPVTASCKVCSKIFDLNPNNAAYQSIHSCGKIYVAYSKAAIKWLESQSKKRRKVIQHAENGGEYKIPGTRFKADGFHKGTNTVFEYLGDYWHKNKKATFERLRTIKKLGYNVIYIWGSDLERGMKPCIL